MLDGIWWFPITLFNLSYSRVDKTHLHTHTQPTKQYSSTRNIDSSFLFFFFLLFRIAHQFSSNNPFPIMFICALQILLDNQSRRKKTLTSSCLYNVSKIHPMSYPARWWSLVSMKSMFTFNFLLYYISFQIINSFSPGDHIWEYKHKCQMSKSRGTSPALQCYNNNLFLNHQTQKNEISRVIHFVVILETSILHDTYGKRSNLSTFLFSTAGTTSSATSDI